MDISVEQDAEDNWRFSAPGKPERTLRADLLGNWRAPMKQEIIGDWRAEFVGVDLLYLKPVAAERISLEISLREDGTASWEFRLIDGPEPPKEPPAPFPTTWDLSDDRVLTIRRPVPPNPECEPPDWTLWDKCYDVHTVTDCSLCINERRFSGENIYILRRINDADFNQRQSSRAAEALAALKEIALGLRDSELS